MQKYTFWAPRASFSSFWRSQSSKMTPRARNGLSPGRLQRRFLDLGHLESGMLQRLVLGGFPDSGPPRTPLLNGLAGKFVNWGVWGVTKQNGLSRFWVMSFGACFTARKLSQISQSVFRSQMAKNVILGSSLFRHVKKCWKPNWFSSILKITHFHKN